MEEKVTFSPFESYRLRMAPVFARMMSGAGFVRANNAMILAGRAGDYLVKRVGHWDNSCLYLAASWRADGWIGFSSRARAAWFTAAEAVGIVEEFNRHLRRAGATDRYTVVRRHPKIRS